ncbi:hypothetical protein OESDEN_16042 [Oesophagostomum dentatum]|uniref:Uncharacterized protein n=1 Tax=Oesophagostomum dentatum TaxID=61180 RepID=A0A0B1SL49_OESDE|nr:hypothetical protein OESDEN_16042 [Oesophagostomum dentatum]
MHIAKESMFRSTTIENSTNDITLQQLMKAINYGTVTRLWYWSMRTSCCTGSHAENGSEILMP